MARILIADDHRIVRQGLKLILSETEDLEVVDEASDGVEALALLRANEYDAVILDITMPGRNGLDVLTELRHIQPQTPVLVLSMHPEHQYAVRALKGGARGYLTKDSAPEELVTALRALLDGRRYITASISEHLVADMLGDPDRPAHEALSERELQVLLRIARGLSIKEIGARLALSPKTVTTYRTRLLEKMGLPNNAALTRYAVRHGLVE